MKMKKKKIKLRCLYISNSISKCILKSRKAYFNFNYCKYIHCLTPTHIFPFFSSPLLYHNCYLGCKYICYSNIFSVRHTVNVFRRKDKALTETHILIEINKYKIKMCSQQEKKLSAVSDTLRSLL